MFLRNVGIYLQGNTAPPLRSQTKIESSSSSNSSWPSVLVGTHKERFLAGIKNIRLSISAQLTSSKRVCSETILILFPCLSRLYQDAFECVPSIHVTHTRYNLLITIYYITLAVSGYSFVRLCNILNLVLLVIIMATERSSVSGVNNLY